MIARSVARARQPLGRMYRNTVRLARLDRMGTERPTFAGRDLVENASVPVIGALALLALAVATLRRGAFFSQDYLLVLLIIACATSALAWRAPRRRQLLELIGPSLTPFLVLTAWIALRGISVGDFPWRDTTVIPVVAILYAVAATAGPIEREMLRHGLVLLGSLEALVGWLGVVFNLHPWAIPSEAIWRAASTITYPNAAGLLLVVALLLEFSAPSRARPAATYVLLLGMMATFSRGAFLALVVGLAVLVVQHGFAHIRIPFVRAAPGCIVAMIGLLTSIPVAEPAHNSIAIVAALLGFLLAVVLHPRWIGIGFVATFLALGVSLWGGSSVIGSVTRGPAPRLSLESPDRASELRAAGAIIASSPLLGTGPGRLTLSWRDTNGEELNARYVHNEYVQLVGEIGVIGAVLLAWVIYSAVARSRAPSGWPVGSIVLAVGIASGFDFVWHVPAVLLMAAMAAGLMRADATDREHRELDEGGEVCGLPCGRLSWRGQTFQGHGR